VGRRFVRTETTISNSTMQRGGTVRPDEFDRLVQDHLDGLASDEDVAVLASREGAWIATLERLAGEAQRALERVRAEVTGPERPVVVADFERECARIEEVLGGLLGVPPAPGADGDAAPGVAPAAAPAEGTTSTTPPPAHRGGPTVRLAAQGRMVPRCARLRRRDEAGGKDLSTFEVDWEPVLIDPEAINELAAARPTAAAATGNRQDGRAFTQSVLSDLLGTICEMAAERLEVPAPPPDPALPQRRGRDRAGPPRRQALRRATRAGAELVRRLDQWSSPVTGTAKLALTSASIRPTRATPGTARCSPSCSRPAAAAGARSSSPRTRPGS
jgi:hypothetical protein